MEPTDIKKIINSIQVEKVDGEYQIAVDMPEKIIVSDANADDAILLSEYMAAAVKECELLGIIEANGCYFDAVEEEIKKGNEQ